jgi:hypothetical protein
MTPKLLSKRNDSRTIARCEVYREVDEREVTIEVTVGGYTDDDLEFCDATIGGMPDAAHYERRVESRLPS